MTEPPVTEDLVMIKDALIILGGFLPFFSDDRDKVHRAERAERVKQDAHQALDRLAHRLGEPCPGRIISKERQKL